MNKLFWRDNQLLFFHKYAIWFERNDILTFFNTASEFSRYTAIILLCSSPPLPGISQTTVHTAKQREYSLSRRGVCRERDFIPESKRDDYISKHIYWFPSMPGPGATMVNKIGKVIGFLDRKMPRLRS